LRVTEKGVSLRVIILVWIASFCVLPSVAQKSPAPLASSSHAEDFETVVLPITQLKADLGVGLKIESKAGTGFCLDPACRFIGTNYHVAMLAHPKKINGQTVVHRYLATGPDDEGATFNEGFAAPTMKYNPKRDLAILELRGPLPHHHGLSFYTNDLRIGQVVEIYSYPRESMIHARTLLQVHGTFEGQTPSGLLAFDYEASDGRTLRPGTSGGIVVDSKTQQIVGVLRAIERSGQPIAFAVPIDSLAEFVGTVQPFLAQSIFPSSQRISPISADVYAKFVPASTTSLQRRPTETNEVGILRAKAQVLADNMRDFIAVQTLSWGSQQNEPLVESQYEVQVLGGYQRFRELPNGKKELQNVPFPPLTNSMVPGGEWSELPAKVGSDLNLKINQAADAIVNGRSLKVFQYWASVEDAVCTFKSVNDFAVFVFSKVSVAACYGEVWTDEDMNILRMSEHLELFGKWRNLQAVVTYGWLNKPGEAPRLIPLTIATQAEYKRKIYWCRGQFTDYRLFTSRARVIASTEGSSAPFPKESH
jgi:hypothetical protein